MAPSGVVFRTISMPLGEETPMHKTLSVDYAVLIEGSVELILDAPYPPELEGTEENELGRKEERRVLNPGDTVVQRGTMHAWRNVGEGWARMVFVMMPAAGLDVQGLEGEVV
jgi:hypothetical protein